MIRLPVLPQTPPRPKVRRYPGRECSIVAVEALRLVCVGATFAPAATLLFDGDRRPASAGEPLVEGFTQAPVVQVHIRNIMKKLTATDRTQVAFLTRGLFEGANGYQRA